MELTIKRILFTFEYTAGILYADGTRICDTLEPPDRVLEWDGVKVKGETAIPLGTYPVTLTYSPKFKRVLPLVGNVRNFEGVRFHSGNSVKDTEGCILVGVAGVGGTLSLSRNTLENLLSLLRGRKPITLTITR